MQCNMGVAVDAEVTLVMQKATVGTRDLSLQYQCQGQS